MSYEGCDVSYVIFLDVRVRLSGAIVTQIIHKKKNRGIFFFFPSPSGGGCGSWVYAIQIPGHPCSSFPFRLRFGHRLFHPVLFWWVPCGLLGSVSVSAATRLAYDMIRILIRTWYIHTYADLTFVFVSEVYDFVSVIVLRLCLIFSFICFPPEAFFRSRVIGACPVTTDCIATMS